MKKFVPRLLAFSVLMVLAAADLLFNFEVERLIIEASVLALLALGIFLGRTDSLVRDIPFFAIGWVLITVLLPNFHLTLPMLGIRLDRLLMWLGDGDISGALVAGILAFSVLQLLFRKKDSIVFIILRHIALLFLLKGAMEFLAGGDERRTFAVLILMCLLSFLYELKTKADGYRERRTLCTLLCGLAYLASFFIFETGDAFWYIPEQKILLNLTIGAGIMGGFIILDEYNKRKNLNIAANSFHDFGGVLVFWCLTSLIMQIWPDVMNWYALAIMPMILYYCYGSFIRQWLNVTHGSEWKAFVVTWSLCTVGLLLFGKYLNQESYVCLLMIALLIAAAACWRVTAKGEKDRQVMTCFLGIAAILMLTAASFPELYGADVMLKVLIGIAMLSVGWCVLCGTTEKLNNQASSLYTNEFTTAIKIERYVPLALLAVAVIKLLVA